MTRDIVNGTAYTFQLRAGGDDGDSLAAEAGRVTPEGPATGLAPTVTSVVVASAPLSGDTYRLHETIVFTVTFSEPVELKPHGRLRLKVGLDNPGGGSGNSVEAVFSRLTREQYPTADTPQFSRARHMHFEYKVKSFDRDSDGVRIRSNALRLASGARIRSEGGDDAELDHGGVGPFSDHKVDARADVPRIERIRVVSTPRLRWPGSREEDTYGEGENIRIGVRFDQPVHVEGEPTMALQVGDPCGSVCEARYESGSGTDTLVFAYLVLDVDLTANGIAIPPTRSRCWTATSATTRATRRTFPSGGRVRRAATRWTARGRRGRTCRWRMPRRTRSTARWISRCAWSRTAWAS